MAKDNRKVALPPIQFFADGPTDEVKEANMEAVVSSPGYADMAILIADALTKSVDMILLDYTKESVSVRYHIDNVWHQMPERDRESGDYMLASLKKLCNLNFLERRLRQDGEFKALFHAFKSSCSIVTQGVKTGERVVVKVGLRKPPLEEFDDLGMRLRMKDELIEHMTDNQGIILFCTTPGDGYSTLWHTALQACDRFTRDFFTIEDVHHLEEEVINVGSIQYNSQNGETPLTPLPQLLLKQPNVLCVPKLPDAATINRFSELAVEGNDPKLVLTRIHAKNAIEALLRVLIMKPDVEKFAAAIDVVVSQRLIRKLCEHCRQPYAPSPQLLEKLGLPAGRVREFFKEWQLPPPEEQVDEKGNQIEYPVCRHCHGIGYRGQTGILELLVVTDEIRQALRAKSNLATLANIAVQGGHITLKDEGIVMVARGITSINELQRVLKK